MTASVIQPQYAESRRDNGKVAAAIGATAIALIAVGAGFLVTRVGDSSGTYIVEGLIAALIVAGLVATPLEAFPYVVLGVTLLVPTEIPFFPRLLQGAALGIIPLTAWILRTPRKARAYPKTTGLAVFLLFWLLLSEIAGPLHTRHGWEWLITVAVALVLVVINTPQMDPKSFRRMFLLTATTLGAYAVLEGLVLHQNLLFGALFEHTSWWDSQQHGVSYRVTTILGHPLVNGTVFAAAAVLAASEIVEVRGKSTTHWVRFALLVGAVLATHSRGAAIALAVGVAVVIIFSGNHGNVQSMRRLTLLLSAVLGTIVIVSGLQARNESSQGQASANVRVTVLSRAAQAVEKLGPFGAGPGEAETYRVDNQLPGSEIPLENSYAELAVSLGPLGALLIATLLGSIIVIGLRCPLVLGEAAGLLTIMVDIAGFNAIEGHRATLVLIGLFVMAILTGARGVSVRRTTPVAKLALASGDGP
jgi:hypothetical protein